MTTVILSTCFCAKFPTFFFYNCFWIYGSPFKKQRLHFHLVNQCASQTHIAKCPEINGLMNGWVDWWMDGWTDGWMDVQMEGWMGGQIVPGWTGGRMDGRTPHCVCCNSLHVCAAFRTNWIHRWLKSHQLPVDVAPPLVRHQAIILHWSALGGYAELLSTQRRGQLIFFFFFFFFTFSDHLRMQDKSVWIHLSHRILTHIFPHLEFMAQLADKEARPP